MNLKTTTRKALIAAMATIGLCLASCQSQPQSNIEKIDTLKKQVQEDVKNLQVLETTDFVMLSKDFMSCDSMLQYMETEQIDKSFETLQLVQAYLEQFKVTKPEMQAGLDTTLIQLDRLKADAESHYLSDSLVGVYLATETEYANKLNNQIRYFQDRFGTCKKNLETLKSQR